MSKFYQAVGMSGAVFDGPLMTAGAGNRNSRYSHMSTMASLEPASADIAISGIDRTVILWSLPTVTLIAFNGKNRDSRKK
jgi:hypothetical protein